MKIIAKGKEVFMSQPPMVELNPPVKICGDTHGQYGDVLRLLNRGGFPSTANYLLLGNYVDRGPHQLEVILLLTCYKITFPKNFFLLRGNHEIANVNKTHGFWEECQRRYNSPQMYHAFQDMFNCMPLTALVGDRIVCMHGGISPHLKNLDQLRKIQRPAEMTSSYGHKLEMDLLWADPIIGLNGFVHNCRGGSYGFGADVVIKIQEKMGVDLVVRGHQVVQDGYEFFGGRRLVTIFSAPHYYQYNNAAAMMIVDENLQCSFEILRPTYGKVEIKMVPTKTGPPC